MFESNEKKNLRQKYNKMSLISQNTGKGKFKLDGGLAAGPSVYGELKLSEKLSNDLQLVKDQVEGLNERLEEALYEKERYKRLVEEFEAKLEVREK